MDLCISTADTFLTLVERGAAACTQSEHVIFFAKNLEKARQWLIERGVAVEAVISDSGGNRFFRLQDLDGNVIEVCMEPGQVIVGSCRSLDASRNPNALLYQARAAPKFLTSTAQLSKIQNGGFPHIGSPVVGLFRSDATNT
jgi:hypothetical protein